MSESRVNVQCAAQKVTGWASDIEVEIDGVVYWVSQLVTDSKRLDGVKQGLKEQIKLTKARRANYYRDGWKAACETILGLIEEQDHE